jgi:hypothetical protein
LFLKKRHEEFLKTSNVFEKTLDVFFKTTVTLKRGLAGIFDICFGGVSELAKCKALRMRPTGVY